MKGNAVIGRSGGPTSVINSRLAGVIHRIKATGLCDNAYGMNSGIKGFMEESLFDLGAQPAHILEGLRGEFQITESLIVCAMDRAIPQDLAEAFERGSQRGAGRLSGGGLGPPPFVFILFGIHAGRSRRRCSGR